MYRCLSHDLCFRRKIQNGRDRPQCFCQGESALIEILVALYIS